MGREVEVAVVGAGVTGLSVAWHLRRRGARVRVLERTGVGAGASGVQPGGVRQQWGTRVNCLLARESVAFYRDFEGPVELGFRACGYLFVAHSDATLERLRANVAVQNSCGVPSRIVSPSEAAALVPGLQPDRLAGASWCGQDGYFDRPQSVVEAFAHGIDVEYAEVVAISGNKLTLGDGTSLHADHVVVAAGVDTPALLPELPIEPEERVLFLSQPIRERLLEPLVVAPERAFAAKQLGDGRVLASDLTGGQREHVRAVIRELLPRLEYVDFPLEVRGVYDVTPDRQAIIGAVDEGLWVAAGFSGHGFMLAPAVGRILADAITGNGEDEALQVLSPARFAAGRLVPEPQVV
jgi:sarcosine oxidase subunit beta